MNESGPLDVIPVDVPAAQTEAMTDAARIPAVVRVRPTEPAAVGGVTEPERIQSIDVLRGFALLGILIMNIQSFSMIEAAYENPTAYGNLEGANYWVWYLSHVLADQRFMTIFSMLFGAGILLMTGRQEKSCGRSAGVHYRRMGVLALFGLLHAYLLWFGDILFSYALCGMLAYLFRKLRPAVLITLGFISITVPALLIAPIGVFLLLWLPTLPAEKGEEIHQAIAEDWQPPTTRVAEEVHAYRESGWSAEFKQRWLYALLMQTVGFAFFTLWRAGGLMLVGMGLFKYGVFSAERSRRFYLKLIVVAACVGIPLTIIGVYCEEQAAWEVVRTRFLYGLFNYWGSVFASLGWIGLIMLWCKQPALELLKRSFAAVGQMALTNYLLHTLICTTIFYGHGFGLFGKVERLGQIGIVFAIWVFQLIVSPIWLHFFRFGPAEWLWRSLTYASLPPLLRRGNTAAG